MIDCPCGSYAINHDPERKLCDCCWRDRKIAKLEAEVKRLTQLHATSARVCRNTIGPCWCGCHVTEFQEEKP